MKASPKNYLDFVVAVQKAGQAKGITSICSAHPLVLEAALRRGVEVNQPVLIEATCNQVNQFGGYTGMRPDDFVRFVHGIADRVGFPREQLILGGDHLGPNAWQHEPTESAMQKSEELILEYVQAGFTKIHLDCSMKLADDPEGNLDVATIAQRGARLAKIAEASTGLDNKANALRYAIGTEVPVPGGAAGPEETVNVTKVEDVRQTIEVTHEAFLREGLESAWERVVGVVVQPGLEFGDDFIFSYRPEVAHELSKFIESQSMIFEAHSTDYQTREALRNLVRDHFAILKVGPGLTFAFREAIFALAMIETELVPDKERSNIVDVMETAMLDQPQYWQRHYPGDAKQQAFRRKFSFSDRIRYYWNVPSVKFALERLLQNLADRQLPLSLLSQYLPRQYEKIRAGKMQNQGSTVLLGQVTDVLEDYAFACGNF
jgi:D-tagatose-1,6-bisphosphate aldolase subunit GatZ/KbaZ